MKLIVIFFLVRPSGSIPSGSIPSGSFQVIRFQVGRSKWFVPIGSFQVVHLKYFLVDLEILYLYRHYYDKTVQV